MTHFPLEISLLSLFNCTGIESSWQYRHSLGMGLPVIGVIPLWDEKKDSIWMLPGYMQGLENAGAAAVILPLTVSINVLEQTAALCDGFLFTGGHDVDPKRYHQKKSDLCDEICETRDKMEEYIFHEAVINQNKPALGICRGIQLFNVFLGGSLYQDIPTEFPSSVTHVKGPPYDAPAHKVNLVEGSPLQKLIGKENIEVNSYHHQGVNRLAQGLEVMATAEDGLVEAVYMPQQRFVWAVQWHPEFWLGDEISKKLFACFVENVGIYCI
jgi:putative glutamine amidotransferase